MIVRVQKFQRIHAASHRTFLTADYKSILQTAFSNSAPNQAHEACIEIMVWYELIESVMGGNQMNGQTGLY